MIYLISFIFLLVTKSALFATEFAEPHNIPVRLSLCSQSLPDISKLSMTQEKFSFSLRDVRSQELVRFLKQQEEIHFLLDQAESLQLSNPSYDEENVNPVFSAMENHFVAYIFMHHLQSRRDLMCENWIDKVFNKPILQKDSGALAVLNIFFPSSFGPGNNQDKQNMFFVGNWESFGVLFADLSGNQDRIERAVGYCQEYKRY